MALPEPGDLFESKYRIDAILGEGGFGRVYEAFDTELGRRVAVKLLKPSRRGDDLTRARRFMREVKAVAGLSHPNTVTLYDYGRTDDGVLFMVSEHIDGVDLSQLCADHGPLTQAQTVHVLIQLLESLREAHGLGLLHRDIKPDNIRVFEYDGDPLRVKLLDFGIAKSLTEEQSKLTGTGKVVGTLRYMSPEQLTGGAMNPASDLYSLGLVAYEMLFGQQARRADDLIDGRFVRAEPSDRVSAEFVAVLNSMLEPQPEQRVADAATVLSALRGLEGRQRIAATVQSRIDTPKERPAAKPASVRPMPEEHGRRNVRRGWLAAAAVGLVVVLAASSFVFTVGEEEDVAEEETISVVVNEVKSQRPNPLRHTADASVPKPERAAGCGQPREPGFKTVSASFGLDKQEWRVGTPEGYDPDKPLPLLITLSGVGEPGFFAEVIPFATQRPYITVHLTELHPKIDATEPPEFEIRRVRSIVKEMKESWCVDEDRVFVFGNYGFGVPTNGSRFAQQLRCEPWLSAIAITTKQGTTPAPLAPYCPDRAVPILQLGRTKPDEGWRDCSTMDKSSCGRADGVLSPTEQRWWTRNRCTGEPSVTREEHGWSCWSGSCEVPTKFCRSDERLYRRLDSDELKYSSAIMLIDQFFSGFSDGAPNTR